MEVVRIQTLIPSDGKIRLEVPSKLSPGPAEVIVSIKPLAPTQPATIRWCDFYGMGKEVWGEMDGQEYVNQLRSEWDR